MFVFVTVIEPALEEYNKLQNIYEIEKGCRYEAQTYASQVLYIFTRLACLKEVQTYASQVLYIFTRLACVKEVQFTITISILTCRNICSCFVKYSLV